MLSQDSKHGPAVLTERIALVRYQNLVSVRWYLAPHLPMMVKVIVELQLDRPGKAKGVFAEPGAQTAKDRRREAAYSPGHRA